MKTIILTLAAAALTFAQTAPATTTTAPAAPHSAPAHAAAANAAPGHAAVKHVKKVAKTAVVKPVALRHGKKHAGHKIAK